jgi:hypothetical protein
VQATVNRNVEGQWSNIKKCLLDTMSHCVGKVEKRARKPWITQETISKMEGNGRVSILKKEEKTTED